VTAGLAPYRGLRPFEDSEADVGFFFGREREREIIAANLMASRLTVLYGETGAGKTSVLRAGVAHRLREEAAANAEREGRPGLAVSVFAGWRDDPVEGIERAVRDAVSDALGRRVALPAGAGESLADRLGLWADLVEGDILLVLDQLEEYFLYHRGEGGPGTLAQELPEIVGRPGLHVNVVLALREDTLARLDVFKATIPGLFGNYLRLDHLDRAEARQAIVGPVDAYDRLVPDDERVEIEPELADAVLDEIAAGKVELGPGRGVAEGHAGNGRIETPYLQLVMQRLWETEQEAGSHVLRLSTFRALGGAGAIVRAHLGRALEALDRDEQAVAAGVFDHLVTPSGTKIAHGAADLAGYAGMPEDAVLPVLTKLSAERILRPVAASDGSGDTRFEIFHDILAEPVLSWKRSHDAERMLEREREAAARRHRSLAFVAGAALVALAVVAALAVFALTQRGHARTEARVATSRELAASAVSQLDTDPELSLLLALRAAQLTPTPQAAAALRDALLASHVRAILRGARGPLSSAVFSPDGKVALTASNDGAARLYAAAGGPPLHVLRHGGPITAAAFDASGKRVLTASSDGTAAVWAVRDGALLRRVVVGAPVAAAALSPSGGAFVTVTADGHAELWSATTGKSVASLAQPGLTTAVAWSNGGPRIATGGTTGEVGLWGPSGEAGPVLNAGAPVRGVAFSRDGSLVLAWTYRSVVVWKTAGGSFVSRLVDTEPGPGSKRGGAAQVQGAAFSPDGQEIVTWSVDGVGRVWDTATGRRNVVLFGHTNYVNDAAFGPTGNWLVTASSDRTARTWVAATGQPALVLAGHSESVNTAAFDAGGTKVLTASDDGTARIWDAGTAPALVEIGRHAGPVTVASFTGSGLLVVSGGEDGKVRFWRLSGGQALPALPAGGPVVAAAVSADGRTALGASRNGIVRLWSMPAGRLQRTFRPGSPIAAAVLSHDGRLVAAGGSDSGVRLWSSDGSSGRTLVQGAPVTALAFSPDGRLLASTDEHGDARLWSTDTGQLVHDLRGHKGAVVAVAFSPDGTQVATAGADGTARLWSSSSGALEHVFRGHTDALTGLGFSSDGSLLVTSSRDHDARIWSTGTGALVHLLRGHFGSVAAASFSPDGRWVVTAGPGSAGLWSVDSGSLVSYLRGHTQPLTAAVFSPDGNSVVTGSLDGTVRLYRCEVCGSLAQLERVAEARLRATGRALTPAERQRFLP
jgi:WD40 repeat protein